MRLGGSQSTVDPDFALEFIATEKDGQQAGWIDQTTDEDHLLPHATGVGYELSQESPYHLQEGYLVLRQYEDLRIGMAHCPNQSLEL